MFFYLLMQYNNQSSQNQKIQSETIGRKRIDADGYTTAEDCDDYNADVFPNQFEVCDGIDNSVMKRSMKVFESLL